MVLRAAGWPVMVIALTSALWGGVVSQWHRHAVVPQRLRTPRGAQHFSIGRLQGCWSDRRRLWTTSWPPAPTQLITLAFPLPGDPRAMNGCAGEHSARPWIARNEQVKGSSPFPGSQPCDQRRCKRIATRMSLASLAQRSLSRSFDPVRRAATRPTVDSLSVRFVDPSPGSVPRRDACRAQSGSRGGGLSRDELVLLWCSPGPSPGCRPRMARVGSR